MTIKEDLVKWLRARERKHQRYLANRDKILAKSKTPEKKEYTRRWNLRNKYDALLAYSITKDRPSCCWCAKDDLCILTIDHINGGGHRASKYEGSGTALYKNLRKFGYPKGYQTLCFDCNCGYKRAGRRPPSRYEDIADR